MERDVQIEAVEHKLLEIEKSIEEENGRARLNRMPARYFMFFFLIGGDEESQILLKRKVKELLSNPDACDFMQITENNSSANYGKEAEEVLRKAATNRIDVQDLNSVYLCPVIFADNNLGSDAVAILKDIDVSINRAGHTSTWQPTIIIDKNTSQYKNIYFTVSEMQRFITDMPEGRVNRCCLLSNLDENRFAVSKENLMQTIAMTVVLQNVVTKNAGDSQTIRSKVSRSSTTEDGNRLFFTARNAAVTNPTRSLLLQRMCSAIDFFANKNDSSAMSRINYSFVAQIMNQYMSALPHRNGAITLFPLYSVMEDSMLHARLEKIIKEKYFEPLCGEQVRKIQLEKAKSAFLERYFAENGSLSDLKRLINENAIEREFLQRKMDCYDSKYIEAPSLDKKKLSYLAGSEYHKAQMYCDALIRNAGWELLEATGKQLSQADMLHDIDNAWDCIEIIKDCIQKRLRQLKEVETVLVVEQTEQRTDFGDVQSSWLEANVLSNQKEYELINRKFSFMIYSLIQNSLRDYGEMLEVCYDAVKNSAYSNNDYLNRVSEECMVNEDRAHEFAAIVEKSWCYTLRFLNLDETRDATCIIGDSKNCFCNNLCEKFNGTLFDFSGFDRIDVLHISGAFSPENILEWEQIERDGKGE